MNNKINVNGSFYAAIIAFFVVNLCADQNDKEPFSEPFFIESGVVAGFFIAAHDEMRSDLTTFDQRLYYGVWTATNGPRNLFVPKQPEYAYQVELLDANGVHMPKTELGKKVGIHFLALNPSKVETKLQRLTAYEKKDNLFGSNLLFRPNDLFVIDKPGTYTLEIRFQFIEHLGTRGDYTNHLIRFPSLKYPIIKPAAATGKTKAE